MILLCKDSYENKINIKINKGTMMNEIMINTVTEENKTIDLLDRQGFVDKLLVVSELLSKNKKNACYAINGSWGVGKSFVLDMFEKQNEIINDEGTALSRYAIFRYNCWEYDYYEEPLIAIVATLLDDIDTKTNLLSQKTRTEAKEILKSVGKCFVKKAISVVEDKTGLPIEDIAKVFNEGLNTANEKTESDKSFDQYISFKENIENLRKAIISLSNEQTVMFIVDELDRCMPEYTITILERLHHLFDDIPNVQVVISVDKKQLEHTIKQIYGEYTDVDRYLGKFIDFELILSEGSFSDEEKLKIAFNEYISMFEEGNTCVDRFDTYEFIRIIFEGIDIRSRIAIINKCMLLHELLKQKDQSSTVVHMCIELLLTVVKHADIDIEESSLNFNILNVFQPKNGNCIPRGLDLLTEKYNGNNQYLSYTNSHRGHYIDASDLWGILLIAFRYVIGIENDQYETRYCRNIDIKGYAKEFWALQQIIS